MRDYQLAYLLNVFRVDCADLYPSSLDRITRLQTGEMPLLVHLTRQPVDTAAPINAMQLDFAHPSRAKM